MQNRRGLIFLCLALAMGVAAAWATQRLVSQPAASEASVKTTPVVVVRTDVPLATSLTKEQLTTEAWPANYVPPGALTSTDKAVGRVVRRPLAAGEPLLEMALFATGTSGGLRAVIDPSYRAVSVKVDNVIGVAGFVEPGAMVDVVATMRRVDLERAIPYSKVILQNVRVLAVDQKLEEPRVGEPEVVSVATLEVTPPQAQDLIYAAHEGRLQLAMRSPKDQEDVETRAVMVADVLDMRNHGPAPSVKRAAPSRRRSVQVINGNKLRNVRF